jgi:hypothetical protein
LGGFFVSHLKSSGDMPVATAASYSVNIFFSALCQNASRLMFDVFKFPFTCNISSIVCRHLALFLLKARNASSPKNISARFNLRSDILQSA